MKKYRAKLNKYNRDKGTYGNGDGKDASHDKNGKITGFVDSSTNKGKDEKSRKKGSKRKMKKGGKTRGLWDNIHAKRKRGESPAKPGDKDYPKTLNVKNGGLMKGPSHEDGGIDIEVEGGEVVINKTVNNAAGKHEKDLLKLNKNPDRYKIVEKDSGYNYPQVNAKDRRQ